MNKKQKKNNSKPHVVLSFSGFLFGNNNECTDEELADAFFFVGASPEFCMSPDQEILDSYSSGARSDEVLLKNLRRFQRGMLCAVQNNKFRQIRTHQNFLDALPLLGLSGNDYAPAIGIPSELLVGDALVTIRAMSEYLGQKKGFRLLGVMS